MNEATRRWEKAQAARVGVVSLYFWPARAFGGPVFSNRDLCRALAMRGIDVRVVTSDAQNARARRAGSNWVAVDPGVLVKYCRGVRGGLFAPGMLFASGRLSRQVDAMYVWGFFVWLLPFVLMLCCLGGVRLVVATGGMLSAEALRVKPLRKRLFLLLTRLLSIKSRAVFHVTSDAEARDVAREIPAARIEIVPLGVEVPSAEFAPGLRSAPRLEKPYFVVLGRLDPHKQIGRVIEAFATALVRIREAGGKKAAGSKGWALLVAGPGSSDERLQLEEIARMNRQEDAVRFLGEVYGDEKNALVSGAAFLVSGSRSENFGMGIAEALARGVPVIASRGCPWPGLNARGCGWWVDDSVEGLADAFVRAMSVEREERGRMGARGREWMKAEFGWDQLGGRYESLLLGLEREVKKAWRGSEDGREE